MIPLLNAIGISLPHIVGFAVAVVISTFLADRAIRYFYQRLLARLVKQDPKTPPQEIEERRKKFFLELELDFGRLIGSCERVLYVYALMSGALGVLTAWVILKAFFGWMDRPETSQLTFEFANDPADGEAKRKLVTYYLYIFGNGLSLVAGIGLGHLGQVVAQALIHFGVF